MYCVYVMFQKNFTADNMKKKKKKKNRIKESCF